MGTIGRTIETRILGTMKINPNLTYNQALARVLKSEGVIISLSSITSGSDFSRSDRANQSAEPPGH